MVPSPAVGLLFAAMIAMPDAGGKSMLCLKHPDKFQDIDEFVWRFASEELLEAFRSKRAQDVCDIYRRTMLTHHHELDRTKLLLSHHPKDAEWLHIACVARIKPSLLLFQRNLNECAKQARSQLEAVTLAYLSFDPAEIYDSHADIEQRCLQLWAAWKDTCARRINAARIWRTDGVGAY